MDSTYQKFLEDVKTFISIRLGIPICELTENTKIEEDVSIGGLDTIVLYEDFFNEFQIVNPEDFPIDKYVTSDNLEWTIIKAVFSKAAREKLRVKTNTVGHLAQIAAQRRWFEE